MTQGEPRKTPKDLGISAEEAQAYLHRVGPWRGAVFRHFKGRLYVVTGRGLDEETLEDLVVYRSLEDGGSWVRPLRRWHESVDGVSRFTWTGTKIDLGDW